MKRMIALLLIISLALCCSACSRVGRIDSMDLLAALEQQELDVSLDEVVSGGDTLTESGVYHAVRLSFRSDAGGRVERITLTCLDASDPDFLLLSRVLTELFCGASAEFFSEIWQTLIADADRGGVQQCRTEQYLFTYSADAMGAVFVIDDQLLHPTEAPSVTVRVTVPLIK